MPHLYDLRRLIQASGYAGTTGQSFRNHVAGAASGAKMRDYIITGSTFGGSIPDPGIDYSSPVTFNMLMNLIFAHSRAANILRTGNTVGVVNAGSAEGFSVTASSNVTGASSNAVDVTVTGPFNAGESINAVGIFDDPGTYTDPGYLHLDGMVSSTGESYEQCYFQVNYLPDSGSYNEMISWVFPIKIMSHSRTTSDIEWEWYNDSSYTSFFQSGYTVGMISAPQDTFTKYLRWRRVGDTFWNNFGVVSAHDNRF